MKKLSNVSCRLYAITASADVDTLQQQVQDAIDGGITMLQIREKGLSTDALVMQSKPILSLCREAGIPCLINDNVEAALRLRADGVHVGQHDMPLSEARSILGSGAILGTSAHNVKEAILAQQQGADYIGCGAVFTTGTKEDATPLSLDTLCAIRRAVTIPMIAIGGITAKNVNALVGSGIDGIAVVSAIFGQKNTRQAAQSMRQLVDRIVTSEGFA